MLRTLRLVLALAFCACAVDDLPADLDDVLVEPGDASEDGKADAAGRRVELKVTVRADQVSAVSRRFRLYKPQAERRAITFYDTAELALYAQGVILRARDILGDEDDSTVKLRPVEIADVDPSWLSTDGFKCEIDRVGDRSVSSCSLTVRQDEGEIAEVAGGERAIDKLFSDEQEQFLASLSLVPAWRELAPMGPTDAWVWKVKPRGFPAGFTAERWELPDGRVFLELSTKTTASDDAAIEAAQQAFHDYLESQGFAVDAAQETKTQAVLEFYAGGGRAAP
jgi:hypothetical protein